ncbi:MAG TPA: 4Fe-4S binding protein [Spirochaetota bacterium]|nr:4Fe-4S binding protein [Spirochaetota bacterium]
MLSGKDLTLTRKSLLRTAAAAAACTIAGDLPVMAREHKPLKSTSVKKAAVIWYSQAGNTRRYGECAARVLSGKGIAVIASDYRDFDADGIDAYDLIVVGSPVFYYDVPGNFKKWLSSLKPIDGTPVAGFVSFGGEGGNQHNTVCTLLDLMAEKGGVPVGMGLFGNMSTYPPTWSMGMEERILKYRHLPDERTFRKVKEFTVSALENVGNNRPTDYRRKFDFREAIKGGFSIFWGARLLTGTHRIDRKACIQCGTCTEKCPTGTIRYASYTVTSGTCIYCYGCVNNCPAGAIDMTYMGKKLSGFNEFTKKHGITLNNPF